MSPRLKGAGGKNAKRQEVRTPEPGKPTLLAVRDVPPGWTRGGGEAGPLPGGLSSPHVTSDFFVAPPPHIKEVLCVAKMCERVFIIVLLQSSWLRGVYLIYDWYDSPVHFVPPSDRPLPNETIK